MPSGEEKNHDISAPPGSPSEGKLSGTGKTPFSGCSHYFFLTCGFIFYYHLKFIANL